MTRHQRDQVIAKAHEQGIGIDQKRVDGLLNPAKTASISPSLLACSTRTRRPVLRAAAWTVMASATAP
jgi:hypothetical protein